MSASGTRNVTVWRPSVRLPVPFFTDLNKSRGAYATWLTMGQNATRPAYISVWVLKDGHTCSKWQCNYHSAVKATRQAWRTQWQWWIQDFEKGEYIRGWIGTPEIEQFCLLITNAVSSFAHIIIFWTQCMVMTYCWLLWAQWAIY